MTHQVAGIIHADNYWKSLYNFHYWHIFPVATGMIGPDGREALQHFLKACDVMDQTTDIFIKWDWRNQ